MNLLDHLSSETFARCMSFLCNSDLITCLQVSKSFNERVQNYSQLYQSVSVSGEEEFKSCYDFFRQKQNKKLAHRVQTLEITDYTIPKTELFNLATVFPNVKNYRHDEGDECMPHSTVPKASEGKTKRNQFANWCQTIESIEEIGSPVVGPAVLAAGEQESKDGKPCLQLTRLHLSYALVVSKKQKRAFLKHVHNAPNLETLKMEWTSFCLEDLEFIHTSCQKLARLEMNHCSFEPTNNDASRAAYNAPETSGKAEALRTLIISGKSFAIEDWTEESCSFGNDATSWIKYFGKKYNLTNLVMGVFMEQRMDKTVTLPEDAAWAEFISKQTNLKFYKVFPIKVSVKMLNAMDRVGIQLKTIDVCNWDCPKYVDFLLKSKQMEYLETLIISGVPYSSLEFFYEYRKRDPRSFLNKLAQFPNIKHLRINQSKHEVEGQGMNKFPLDVVLTTIPQLESITMDFATILVEDKNDKVLTTDILHLRKLDLIECYMVVKAFDNEEKSGSRFRYYPSDEVRENSHDYIEKVLPQVEILERGMDDVLFEESFENYLL